MNSRIQKVIGSFHPRQIDAFLVTKDVNIKYLTDFPAGESWLLVASQKVFYITDFRYVLEAKDGLKGIVVQQYTRSIAETVFDIARRLKIKVIGFDDQHLLLSQYKSLKQNCPKNIQLKPCNYLVENLREVKEKKEINEIQKALGVHLEAYTYIKKYIKPNISEREMLFKIEGFVKSRGVGFSFPPIVASGPNSCFPHAKVTDRRFKANDIVLVDMGIDINGYKSDLTRMFFLGKIPPFIYQVNSAVSQAQREAIKRIKAGIAVAEIDQAARNSLRKNKLDKFFGHALGHGVGLEIHESPRLSVKSPAVLKAGMVITVEPAVYIPHKFGIRIEDMVLVTKEGYKVLSQSNNI